MEIISARTIWLCFKSVAVGNQSPLSHMSEGEAIAPRMISSLIEHKSGTSNVFSEFEVRVVHMTPRNGEWWKLLPLNGLIP